MLHLHVPDKPVSRNYKTKEFTVADFIKEQFPTYTWRADKTVLDVRVAVPISYLI
jgi:hypothetical protein